MIGSLPLLRGVRVLDFTWIAAGPSGTLMLALAGADVIKVESRAKLDNYRKNFAKEGDVDRSVLFASVNVGKRSITVDAKKPEGRDLLLELAGRVDLVVENFSPGAMERLGLGFADLSRRNPRLVMVSSSAAGQSGPKREYSGFASIFSAQGGLAAVARRPDGTPVRFSRSIDSRVGTAIAVAAMSGLLQARRTGTGLHLDVSGQEVVAAAMGDVVAGASPIEPSGRCFKCADGWIYVEAPEDDVAGICSTLERDEAVSVLRAAGSSVWEVPETAELLPARGEEPPPPWGSVAHPVMGTFVSIGSPIRWARSDLVETSAPPAPRLGEHTDDVLVEMLSDQVPLVDAARSAGALR